jgi:hypothetical protein
MNGDQHKGNWGYNIKQIVSMKVQRKLQSKMQNEKAKT